MSSIAALEESARRELVSRLAERAAPRTASLTDSEAVRSLVTEVCWDAALTRSPRALLALALENEELLLAQRVRSLPSDDYLSAADVLRLRLYEHLEETLAPTAEHWLRRRRHRNARKRASGPKPRCSDTRAS